MKFKNISDIYPELITWEDISQCPETWSGEAEVQKWLKDVADAHVEQVGFVIAEDARVVIMTDGLIESMELYGNVTKIPKSNILKRVRLSLPS